MEPGRYKLSMPMRWGSYQIAVTHAAATDRVELEGDSELRAATGRQFVVVEVIVMNTGKVPATFTLFPALQLTGADGVAHELDLAATQRYDRFARSRGRFHVYGPQVRIAPGKSVFAVVLFDVPDGAFDGSTWVGLRGQDMRVSLLPAEPEQSAILSFEGSK